MKAAFLESTKSLIFKEIPVPSISDDEVLIKEVGLRGSDVNYYKEVILNKRVVGMINSFVPIPNHAIVPPFFTISKDCLTEDSIPKIIISM